MNKNVSLAIEKAVGSIGQKNQNELKNNGPKKPDLFSLSGETELFQNEKGITIKILVNNIKLRQRKLRRYG